MNTSQRLGPYELQQCLEHTQQGEVWKAFDTQQRYYVSLYILHIGPQIAPGTVNLFFEKMRQLAALHHPNIVQVLDVRLVQTSTNASERGILIATEYVEYQPLTGYIQAITRAGQLPSPEEIVRLLAPLCDALDYAHQHGIVHGSIRPDSILLSALPTTPNSPGMPRLIHFCTQYVQPPLTLPLNASFYVAPEQAQGDLDNPRSDIYALGVLLYELCTGTRPFYGDNPADVLMQHVHMTPPSPAFIQPHLLPAVTAVIVRCLAKDPAARFPTASAVSIALAKALNLPAPDLASQPGIPAPENSRHDVTMKSMTYLSPSLLSAPPTSIASAASAPVTPAPSQQVQPLPGVTPLTQAITDENTTMQPRALAAKVSPPVPTPSGARWKPSRRYIVLAAVLMLALLISGTGVSMLLRSHNQAQAASPVVGHAFFTNSGQYTPNSAQGIADVLQIYMNGIPNPQPNNSYYFWLLADIDGPDNLPILLGTSTSGGNITLPFGDRANHDLLANYSRFLVTEENSGIMPNNPSYDRGTWRYYAEFSQTVNPRTNLSLLDHLRHLLAKDPKLQKVGLSGGLDVWLYRNTLNVMVLASSIRDAQQTGSDPHFIRRQLVRILDYLDSSQYIKVVENLPPGLAPVQIDPTIARVALLEFDVNNQSPPGYLRHIGAVHLSEIVDSPGVTPEQKHLAIQINKGLDNIQGWLNNVHKDAQELMHMSDSQLQQNDARPLFNDLYIQANHAFTGQLDPHTNQVNEGVSQIHAEILRLATFDIQAYQGT